MRTFYNGYCFSEPAQPSVYNPTLSLYFLKHLSRTNKPPSRLLDENMAMDRNKLAYIGRLEHGQELLIHALDANTPLTIPELAQRFGVEDMLNAVKDQTFMASLLYYFGILTLKGTTPFGELMLSGVIKSVGNQNKFHAAVATYKLLQYFSQPPLALTTRSASIG
jgi:hypothetical protein